MAKSVIGTPAPAKRNGISVESFNQLVKSVQDLIDFANKGGKNEPVIRFRYGGQAQYADDMPSEHNEWYDVEYSVKENAISIIIGD